MPPLPTTTITTALLLLLLVIVSLLLGGLALPPIFIVILLSTAHLTPTVDTRANTALIILCIAHDVHQFVFRVERLVHKRSFQIEQTKSLQNEGNMERGGESRRDRETERHTETEIQRYRDRDRDRDRETERERGQERSRERGQEREVKREKERSREVANLEQALARRTPTKSAPTRNRITYVGTLIVVVHTRLRV
jgi:hypothetical protein